MREFTISALLFVALSGCSRASAAELSSDNPAHCYAAFGFGNHWLAKGSQFSAAFAEGEARMLFEMEKSRSNGQSNADLLATATTLTKRFGDNPKRMFALVNECARKQDADHRFQRQFPALLTLVREHPSAI